MLEVLLLGELGELASLLAEGVTTEHAEARTRVAMESKHSTVDVELGQNDGVAKEEEEVAEEDVEEVDDQEDDHVSSR